MISKRNIKQKFTHKIQTIKIFIVLGFTFLSCGIIFSQNQTDSLRKDSSINMLRVKLKSKDSTSGFVPVSKLNSNDVNIATEPEKKIPGRAGLYSAILPGLGQAYNGNYWKIPIIYSLFATIFFIGEDNNDKYQTFKEAYRIYDEGGRVPGLNPNFTEEDLREYKDYYKRNRDFNIIIGVAIYFLNILDASVDAHLMNYDIGEDLSLKISPEINSFSKYENYKANPGFGLKFVLSMH